MVNLAGQHPQRATNPQNRRFVTCNSKSEVLTLTKLLCSVGLVISSFPRLIQCEVPWLVGIVPVSTPNTTTPPTFVDRSVSGNCNFGLSTDLPTQDGEVFTNALFSNFQKRDNVRLYNRYGHTVLSFSGGSTGLGSAFVKSQAGSLSVLTNSWWSKTQKDFFQIQPVQVAGNTFAVRGPPSKFNHTRAALIIDDKNTVYFFAVGEETAVKLSSGDGSVVAQSAVLGSNCDYPTFLMLLPSLNSVLAWFRSNNHTGLFD